MDGYRDDPQNDPKLIFAVECLHGAFRDSAAWPNFLAAVADSVGAQSATMVSLQPAEVTGTLVIHGLARSAIEQWQLLYQGNDPYLASVKMPVPGGRTVYRGADIVSLDQLQGTEYSNSFLEPNNLGYHIGAWINPVARGASPYALMLWRGRGQPDFSSRAMTALSMIAGWIAGLEQVSIANVLSRAGGLSGRESAAYLLNSHGGLLMTNARGAELIESDVVRVQGRTISFATPGASSWIKGMLSGGDIAQIVEGSVDQSERMPGLGAVNLSLYPLSAIGSAPSLLGVRYGLTLKEADTRATHQVARVANKMYRWTGAELDTVRRLADGYTVPDIARERDCSVETVRSHLKNAKRKAGVNRQVELVRLMMSLQGSHI